MTGVAEINFGGAREVYLGEFEKGTEAREIYPSLDQMNKVRIKDSKGFCGRNREFKQFFRPKTDDFKKKKNVFTEIVRDFAAEIGNLSDFSRRKQVISKKKKKRRSSSQKIITLNF